MDGIYSMQIDNMKKFHKIFKGKNFWGKLFDTDMFSIVLNKDCFAKLEIINMFLRYSNSPLSANIRDSLADKNVLSAATLNIEFSLSEFNAFNYCVVLAVNKHHYCIAADYNLQLHNLLYILDAYKDCLEMGGVRS